MAIVKLRVFKLTDPSLFDFPLIFAAQPGGMHLRKEEIVVLRRYLNGGGVLWVDDFRGDRDWDHFESEMARVLPRRRWVDLPMSHPIFRSVFDLKGPMNRLQVPTLQLWLRGYAPDNPTAFRGPGSRQIPCHQHRFLLDDPLKEESARGLKGRSICRPRRGFDSLGASPAWLGCGLEGRAPG